MRKKCVSPGVIFGPFGGNFGPFWDIFGPCWTILGHLGSYLGHFGAFWVISWNIWTNLRKVQIFCGICRILAFRMCAINIFQCWWMSWFRREWGLWSGGGRKKIRRYPFQAKLRSEGWLSCEWVGWGTKEEKLAQPASQSRLGHCSANSCTAKHCDHINAGKYK